MLESPGGELAFDLQIDLTGDSLTAYVINGIDTTRFSTVRMSGDSLILRFDFYDSELRSIVQSDGTLRGQWSKRSSGGARSRLPFRAVKGQQERYRTVSEDHYRFDGNWAASFTDEDGSFPAYALFVSEPGGTLHGTFRTETGDYRFLEGIYRDSSFVLSTFDGAHAFLFKARMQPDGTLKGDFWSRDTYHATWTAEKGEDHLRDPYQISADEAVGRNMQFTFPDLEGEPVSASDVRFQNKPMLVYLFGSWCPNCADEARMIREIYRTEYANSDLQIVGLAYEYTGNFEEDAEMVRRYKQRFDIPWTLLVAGTSSKKAAAETLPFLEEVISYPTSIFVNRDHIIEAIHVGFNGPATGAQYFKEKQRFKKHLDTITGRR